LQWSFFLDFVGGFFLIRTFDGQLQVKSTSNFYKYAHSAVYRLSVSRLFLGLRFSLFLVGLLQYSRLAFLYI